MKIILVTVFLTTTTFAEEFKLGGLFFGCERDVTLEYHRALQEFSTRLYKAVARKHGYHFALSQYSIWLSLSSIAEGTDGLIQQQLFKTLNLPQDSCLREKYYEIATSLESPGNDVMLSRKRLLVLDEELKLNTTWTSNVRAAGLIDTRTEPIKNNPEKAINALRELISADMDLNLTSNSLLLDSLDYEGLWTTAFENSTLEKNADFFNDDGEKIGTVDLLKIKKRVKLAQIPLLNTKLLELPVGNSGRYRMLFMTNLGKGLIRRSIENFPSSFMIDSMPLMIESVIPLEVAIPKFTLTSEMDLKSVLKDVEVNIWENEEASKYISQPPATPSTLLQRVTVTLDSAGLEQPPLPGLTDLVTGLAASVGRDFTANRPFVFGLVDSQTRTWLFSGAFSKPEQSP